MIRLLSPLFLLSLLFAQPPAAPTEAQEPSPTPEPKSTTSAVFSVFTWPNEGILMEDTTIPPLPRIFYDTPQGIRRIQLTRNGSTPLLPYQGSLPLSLFDIDEIWVDPPEGSPPDTPPTREIRKIPKIVADFPQSWQRVQLIIFPGRVNSDGTIQTLALPYEQEKVRPGQARIFNATNQDYILEFPELERAIPLPSNQPLDFDVSEVTETGFLRVFVYRIDPKNQPEMVHTSRIYLRQEHSNYFFLYPQGRRRIRIMRLSSHPGEPVNNSGTE